MQSLACRAGPKGLELLCRFEPDLPDTLVGDAGRLAQIIVNLVGNAIKFTDRGEVEVDVSAESKDADSADLHFIVRDTGIGIPADHQQKIFESFRQADASTTKRYGGTGLGLSISSQLVEMMNGRIWVESEVGKGTEFHFTARFDVHDQQPTMAGLDALSGTHVLVADNNPTHLRILRELLGSWGLVVSVYDNAQDALVELRRAAKTETPYQIAMIDCVLPDMDGFSLVEGIHEELRGTEFRTILFSTAAKAKDIERCQSLGVTRHMQKPLVQSDLLAALLRANGKDEYLTESASLAEAQPHVRRLRILLAEDGVVNQKVAIGLLSRQGHEVVLACDGAEAVKALEDDVFDLVLMDIQMPNLDGHQATRIIRQREQASGRHTPIVAMTAGAMKGDEEQCLESGMDAYVAKPFNPEILFNVIAKCTEQHEE